jgi:hypothetical protein
MFYFVIKSKIWAAKTAMFRQMKSSNRILILTGILYGKKPLNNQLREGSNMKVALKEMVLEDKLYPNVVLKDTKTVGDLLFLH